MLLKVTAKKFPCNKRQAVHFVSCVTSLPDSGKDRVLTAAGAQVAETGTGDPDPGSV